MTLFDPLTVFSSRSDGRSGQRAASSGDWAQAMERAQAQAWLQGRGVAASQPQARHMEKTIARQLAAAIVTEPDQAAASDHAISEKASEPTSRANSPRLSSDYFVTNGPRFTSTPAAVVMEFVPRAAETDETSSAMDLRQTAEPRARLRRRSLHIEQGEDGVRLWIRDATLSNQEATGVAQAVVRQLDGTGAGEGLAALYLNGTQQLDRKE